MAKAFKPLIDLDHFNEVLKKEKKEIQKEYDSHNNKSYTIAVSGMFKDMLRERSWKRHMTIKKHLEDIIEEYERNACDEEWK